MTRQGSVIARSGSDEAISSSSLFSSVLKGHWIVRNYSLIALTVLSSSGVLKMQTADSPAPAVPYI
jgi:hypothetical protein